jgi:hypothetical protein
MRRGLDSRIVLVSGSARLDIHREVGDCLASGGI